MIYFDLKRQLEHSKRSIFQILTIIGMSFGIIGTAGWSLYLGIRYDDLFTVWASAIGIGITLVGLGVWSANLVLAISRYCHLCDSIKTVREIGGDAEFEIKGGDENVERNPQNS